MAVAGEKRVEGVENNERRKKCPEKHVFCDFERRFEGLALVPLSF
jgi:hypothetical protein